MKAHDLVIAILAVLVFLLISLPYQFAYSYWAESTALWVVYIVVGVILAVFVFFNFLQDWRRLVAEAEGEEKKEVAP
ncbi:MAG TPA: hypothetical protein VFL17_20740 [Anaerolineae bacterium]|nr:hypothetical protein [Anaerolineae bacterium]